MSSRIVLPAPHVAPSMTPVRLLPGEITTVCQVPLARVIRVEGEPGLRVWREACAEPDDEVYDDLERAVRAAREEE